MAGTAGSLAWRMIWNLSTLWVLGLLAGVAQGVTPVIAAGEANSFAIDKNGKLWGWGSDEFGQLGTGSQTLFPSPVKAGDSFMSVRSSPTQSVLTAGNSHALALKSDGSLWSWGYNTYGQLGSGTTTASSAPFQVGTGYRSVTAGYAFSLAIKSDGTLWAWGDNSYGQLGDGTTSQRATPLQIGTGFVSVAAGFCHSVGIKVDGTLWAWGCNDQGQLGDGTTNATWIPKLIGSNYSSATARIYHTLALKNDGTLFAWGNNDSGQLGDGTTTIRLAPVRVAEGFQSIAAGYSHAAGIKADGTLWAWGGNWLGQLGDGTFVQRNSPVMVANRVATISLGEFHTLFIKTDGTLWGSGWNDLGQIGDGTTNTSSIPVQIGSGYAVAAGGMRFSLATKVDGTLWAWGSRARGELGLSLIVNRTNPSLIGSNYAAVAEGFGHTIALQADGTLWSWSGNYFGERGDGLGVAERSTPGQIGTGFRAIAAGAFHSVALKLDGTLWSFGLNNAGQLGIGTTDNASIPTLVGSGFAAVAAGGWRFSGHTIALKTDGSLWTWGDNSYCQLGDGTTTNKYVPVMIGSGFAAIAAGNQTSFAIKTDGTLYAWGANWGQFGDGTTSDSCSPILIGPGFKAVATGADHTVALKLDGSLWTWGNNFLGKLGDGTTEISLIPKQVGNGFSVVAAGQLHTVALRSDGTVWVAGSNDSGQLGNGTYAQYLSPVLVINATVDGFLNLNSSGVIIPTLEFQVPFFVSTTGSVTDSSATLITTINFNAVVAKLNNANGAANTTRLNLADAGMVGSVYVTAMVPPNWPAGASGTSGFVLKQLTPSGWQLVVNNQLIPYATGVLNDLLATQTILNGVDTTKLKGAVFCLGYGTSAPEMTAAGTMRSVAAIPNDPTAPSVTVSCNVAASSPVTPLTGLWWNQTESGWGISVTQHSAMMFLAWYTYDAIGNPVWYVMSSCPVINNNACSGDIYQVVGGTSLIVPWNSSTKAVTTAGTGSLTFYDNNNGVLNYTLNGTAGVKGITRQVFATGAAAPPMDFSDLWWNGNESGWGVALTQEFGTIFATLYSYDNGGNPRWYVASNCPLIVSDPGTATYSVLQLGG
jgi:alpha-tubulin suppressor-like RCC1 family protein